MTSLRPVAGDPRELLELLAPWVHDGGEPLVVRTSGSTGQPKDVVLSHRAMLASARATHERLGGPGQWLLAMPVTAVGGLQVLVRSLLAGTRPVLAAEHVSLAEAIEAMDGTRRYASLVPTQVHRLAQAGELDVLRRLDALLVGGAAMPQALRDATDAAGVTVVRTYGMSETCGGCVYDGVPLPGVQVRIDDDGQVLLGGATLFDGYADPDATAAVLADGWFATRDLGEVEDGVLRVLGRSDDVVVSGGVNVPLPAVTDALRALPDVQDAVALGVPDDEWGQRVVAFVVGGPPSVSIAWWRDAVQAEGLDRRWAPREVQVLDALPLLPGGKVDRVGLRALASGVSSPS